ncbi:uncharacterized protein LOC143018159 isoform X3 [Oratosquilla oratoria]|uniref:uncharacterized protein LOC143018159 isoform X3 n=1 Tax=Oratosquilla oratoria TaxID=337810 RepID=UPI003F76BF60
MGSLKSNDDIMEGWEDWDPRVEDYIQHGGHRSSFRRSANMVKVIEQTKEPVGLYVRNVPLNMTNDSLQKIFSEFGSILSVFVGKRKGDFPLTYAIIKVPSKREALKIIENVHGKPPLNLLVSFALTEEERERKRTEKQMDQNFQKQLDVKYESDFIKRKKEDTRGKNEGQFKSVPNGCGRGKILVNTAKLFKGKKNHDGYSEENEKFKEKVETNKPLECVEEALVANSFYYGYQKPSDKSLNGNFRSKDFPLKRHNIVQSTFEGCMTNNKGDPDVQNSEIKQVDGPRKGQLSLKKMMEYDMSTIPKRCREKGLKKNGKNNFNSSPRTEALGMPQECQKGNRNTLNSELSQSFIRQENVNNMSSLSELNSRKSAIFYETEKTLPLDVEVLNVKCFDKAEQKKRGSCVTLVMKDEYDPVDRTLESLCAPPPSPSSPSQENYELQSETNTNSSQVSSCSLLKTLEPPPLRMPTSARGNHIRPLASVNHISEGFPLTSISDHLNIDETYIGLITVVQSHWYFCALLLSPLACNVIGIDQDTLEALPSVMESKIIAGSLVLAYSPTYELWYRAFVYKVEETNIHVCYIDYGNLEVVQIVKTMPEELSGEVPGLAVVARVHGDIEQSSQNWLQANIGIDKQVVMKVLAKKNRSLKVAILDDGASVIAHFILQPWYAALPREQPGDKPSQEVQVINHAHQQKKGTREDLSVASIHTTIRDKIGCGNGRTLVNEISHSFSGASNVSNTEREGNPYNVEQAEFRGSSLSEVGLTLGPEITTRSLPKFWARDVPKQELSIGCQYNVLPVWVVQGNVICVQIITEKNVELCQKIEKEISTCCEKGTHPNIIQVGELVCGFFASDSVWYRAEVMAVEENFVSVYFIDFGNSEKLPSKSVRQMDKILVEIPALCIQATLDQVSPDSQEVLQYLKELVMKEKILIMEVLSLNPVKVKLFEDGSLVNVLFSSNRDEKNGRQVELKLPLSSKSCPDTNDTTKHADHSVTVSMKTGSSSNSLHQVSDDSLLNSAYQDSLQSNQNNRTSKTPLGKEAARQDVSVQPKNLVKDLEDAFTNTHGKSDVTSPTTKVEDAVQKLKGKLYKPKMLMYNECASVELPVGKDIPVIILQATDPFSIFVAPQTCVGMLESLEEMSEEMNAYCNSKHATYYRPPVGEVCIAKFSSDERWYRAACLNLGAESALVIFTDYGNIETVDCADICQMVEPFLKLPLLAQHCVLGGIKEKEYSKELSSRLSEALPASSIHLIEVKCQQEDCTYVIEIPDVVDTLVAEGLLEKN